MNIAVIKLFFSPMGKIFTKNNCFDSKNGTESLY